MSDDWVQTTLGKVAEFVNGYPFKPNQLSGTRTPVIRIKQLLDEAAEVDYTDVEIPTKNQIDEGDLIFSWSGTLASRFWHRGPAALNQHLFRVHAKEGTDLGWLHLALDHAVKELLTKTHGTTMKHVTKGVLESHKVLLPPLPVQRRIVDLLAHLDNHLANLQTEREAAEIAATTLREYLFNGAAEGALMPLAEVADWYSGSTPKAGSPEYYEGGTIPWAVIADVLNGPITETATLITEAGLEKIGRLAPIGAVLVTMYGTIGRVGLARVEMATNQAIAWGVAKSNVLPEYLFHALRQLGPRLDSLGRGATQRNINREILRSQLIRLPKLERQQEVVTTLNSLDESVNALDMEIATAEQLRGSMLSALLTGSLLIPELYDSLLSEVA